MENLKEKDVLNVIKIILSEEKQNADFVKNIFLPLNKNNLKEYFAQFHIKICIDNFSFNKMKSNKLNIVITKENEILVISSFNENTFVIYNQKGDKKRNWKDYEFKNILNVIDIQVDSFNKEKNTFIVDEVYQHMKINKLLVLSICLLMFISSVLIIASSFYLEVIFDLVIVNYLFSYLWPMTFYFLCIMLLVYSLKFCIEKLSKKYIAKVVYERRNVLVKEMKNKVKIEYLPRMVSVLDNVPKSIFSITLEWFASLPLLFLGALLFNYDTNLFIICLLMGILNILIGVGFSSYIKGKYKSFLLHHVDGIITENKNILNSDKLKKNTFKYKEFNGRVFLNQIFICLLGISIIVLFAYLTRMILLDIISIGILFIYLAIALSFLLPFLLFGKLYVEGSIYEGYLEIYNSLYRYGKYIETTFWNDRRISRLSLQNVKLPNYSDNKINNVQFDFSKGALISIVGGNNSGKSYLANSLTNSINTPTQTVFYDEEDICNLINSKEFEKKIVLLNSFVKLRSGETILNNITQGENYSEKDIYDACKEACILNFINNLPNKFYTIIESETQFSVTEKKLIRLAATLLNEAEVIVFDSFFDQLDSNKERNILENLKKVPGAKVVISKQNINTDLFNGQFLLTNGILQRSEGVNNL
ncbi:ABC transporter ATP-binding protein [Listeria welshimeri]|nr:ABC transporter ATP-binding protein [Listeria welshimeri]